MGCVHVSKQLKKCKAYATINIRNESISPHEHKTKE